MRPRWLDTPNLSIPEQLNDYRRLGYRGDEKVGQSGIEKSMEQYLAGNHGGALYVVDPNGQIVTRLGASDPQPADSVYLTIDRNLQYYAQQLLSGYDGSVVVLERDTGRVLAMASSPGYDQNLFDPNNANSSTLLSALVNDPEQPLVNRAAQEPTRLALPSNPSPFPPHWKAGFTCPKLLTTASTISLSFSNMAGRSCTTGPGNIVRTDWQQESNAIPATVRHQVCSPYKKA